TTTAISPDSAAYIHWLEERSMLHQADVVAQSYAGSSIQWHHPYGNPQPRAAVAGASVLTTLADERLWTAFQAIGIQGIHTGPMKLSGGIHDLTYTPSVDGNFDRISFEIRSEEH